MLPWIDRRKCKTDYDFCDCGQTGLVARVTSCHPSDCKCGEMVLPLLEVAIQPVALGTPLLPSLWLAIVGANSRGVR